MNRSDLKRSRVLGDHLAYREAGDDKTPLVLFLHGNPTSSYIWRSIIPRVAAVAHCIAPDLIGFGESDKPDIDYRFTDHVRYLDQFIEQLREPSFYLVAQDWGTALAFHFAARRPERVRGLAFMEFILPMRGWEEFHQSAAARKLFQQFRTPGVGEELILRQNLFIERVLPGSIKRTLLEEERAAYRAPFQTPRSRRPILRLPRELPIESEPRDVHELIEHAQRELCRSTYPKLLFAGDPGALVSPAFAQSFAAELINCEYVPLGSGLHYLQEDHPEAIGARVARWIERHERVRGSSRTVRDASEHAREDS